eukprot:Opistho-1_new@73027
MKQARGTEPCSHVNMSGRQSQRRQRKKVCNVAADCLCLGLKEAIAGGCGGSEPPHIREPCCRRCIQCEWLGGLVHLRRINWAGARSFVSSAQAVDMLQWAPEESRRRLECNGYAVSSYEVRVVKGVYSPRPAPSSAAPLTPLSASQPRACYRRNWSGPLVSSRTTCIPSGCAHRQTATVCVFMPQLTVGLRICPVCSYASSDWGWNDGKKRAEMTSVASLYLIARESVSAAPVAFSHFQFDQEDGVDVLYCYEIQLEGSVRRVGLGAALMRTLEAIGVAAHMRKLMLTVFKGECQRARVLACSNTTMGVLSSLKF